MKLKLLLLAVTLSSVVAAQQSNVQSAANSLKFKELKDAKDYIDKAAEHEQTKNDPKMWLYRGKIYQAISRDTSLRKTNPDASEISTVSFLNCLKTDTKGWYTDECKDNVWVSAVGAYNKAIEAYNKNELEKANRLYNLIFDVFPYDTKEKNLARSNITQEGLYKNLYFVAAKLKDNKKAKEYLQKLIDVNFNDPTIYIYMSRLQLAEKDTAKAIETISKGRSLFDTNNDLINEELNIYIAKGNTDVLIEKISKAIEADPERELLYYNRGVLYEKKKAYDKAIEDYKKAVSIKEDYFDAYYNLGAMIFNQGAEMMNAANDLKSDTEFNKAKAKADLKFKESVPHLEKAHEIKPRSFT
mgnify:CR=1 FL=1